MSSFAKTRELYDAHAHRFADKFDKIPETDQLDEFIAELPEGARVLDIGCGSGRDCEYLAQAGCTPIGVDVSRGLIAEAKKRRPSIEFRVMSMLDLDFEPESFDGAWSKLAILHIEREKLPLVLQQVRTVLKKDGIFMLETKAGSGEHGESVSFMPESERHFVFYSLPELKQALKAAGFTTQYAYEYVVDNRHATHNKRRVVLLAKKTGDRDGFKRN